MGKGQPSARDPIVVVLDENLAGEELRDDLATVAKANGATIELRRSGVKR